MQNALTPKSDLAEHAVITPHQRLQEVEEIANDLKRLLVQHESALDEEGVRREIEILERWMESYRRGLSAAHKISQTGVEWLSTLRDRLKLAAEESQRLESEGGNPASKEQILRTEQLLAASRRIEKAIPDMEQIFSPAQEEHA